MCPSRSPTRSSPPLRAAILSLALSVSVVLSVVLLSPPVRVVAQSSFVRGDPNQDGAVNITDAVLILLHLTRGHQLFCEDAADVDDNGALELSDAIADLSYLYLGTAAPEPPFPACGSDPGDDELTCERFVVCPAPRPLPDRMVYGFGRFLRAAFSHDGERILVTTETGIVALLDTGTLDVVRVLDGHLGQVNSGEFSRDDRWALTAGGDGQVKVWDVATGELDRFFEEPDFVTAAVFSANASRVFFGGDALGPRGRHLDTGTLETFTLSEGDIFRLAMSPEGRLLAAGRVGSVGVVDVATGAVVHVLRRPAQSRDLRFSPDGRMLVEGSVFGLLYWDLETGEVSRRNDDPAVTALDVSADGRWLLTGEDVDVVVRDFETTEAMKTFPGAHRDTVRGTSFAPDGTRAVSVGEGSVAILWDVETGAVVRKLSGHLGEVGSVAISPHGALVATAGTDSSPRLWDAASGSLLRIFEGHTSVVRDVTFTDDGRGVLSASLDRTVKLWNVETGALERTFRGAGGPLLSVTATAPRPPAFGDALVAAGSTDGRVHVWELGAGRLVREFRAHDLAVNDVASSADGLELLTASADGTARLWSAVDGEPAGVLRGHEAFVRTARFSSDGAAILTASGDGTARLWSRSTLEVSRTFEGHEDWVAEARFLGADRVATASGDGRARVFAMATGELLEIFEGHEGIVRALSAHPSGTHIITGAADGTARLWRVGRGGEEDE